MVFGTTGEATSFSIDERLGALEGLLSAGISPDSLVVGTGCAALTDTVYLTRHAAGLGCNEVLMLPPFYFKQPSEDGLFRSYAEVVERAKQDAVALLENDPGMVNASLETLRKRVLVRYGRVVDLGDVG